MRALMRTVAPKAFWVNPPELAAADGFKPLQLRLAAEVGMRIPETLFSNDPDEIARFFRRLDGEVVHKCYRGHGWSLDGASDRIRAVNRTVAVLPEDLAQKAALAAAPGIFQRAIPKSYELRVTAMGRTLVAARIDSQKHESTREDWRSGYHELEIEPYTLPADIAAACRRYMQMSGLNFGCFDFIVTPDGVYYFLEVNQMGQFLWKERYCPDLPMLQIFCEFLAAADPAFEWREKTPDISFPAFFDSDAGAAYCA